MPGSREADAVLALLADRGATDRLVATIRTGVPGVVRAGADLVRVERLAEARATLATQRFAIVVVEARDADGLSTNEFVRQLRATRPNVVVVGYTRLRTGLSTEVLAFARAGVHELVMGSVDDFGPALRAGLASGAQRSGAERLLAEVSSIVAPALVPLVRYCFEHGGAQHSLPEMADALGVSRQTLAARTRAANMPAPSELAAWCRLLLAADLLGDPSRLVEEVALELDFPSGNGLRNTLRRHAGLTIQDVRDQGAAPVLRAFHEAVAGTAASFDFAR